MMILEEKNNSMEDLCASDKLDSFGWAVLFIWGGLVLLAGLTRFATSYAWWDGGAIFFTGAGIIVLTEAFVRLILPEYRDKFIWTMIVGFILLSIGLETAYWIWPVILFVIGGSILKSMFTN